MIKQGEKLVYLAELFRKRDGEIEEKILDLQGFRAFISLQNIRGVEQLRLKGYAEGSVFIFEYDNTASLNAGTYILEIALEAEGDLIICRCEERLTIKRSTLGKELAQEVVLADLLPQDGVPGIDGYVQYRINLTQSGSSLECKKGWKDVEEVKSYLGYVFRGKDFTYNDFTEEQIRELQTPAIEAASAATEATVKANEAANSANEAASTASQAGAAATEATLKANEAANSADEAASTASQAGAAATEATLKANEAANSADEAASTASQAGAAATVATLKANEAANSADEAASTASQAADAATEATIKANTAANSADEAAGAASEAALSATNAAESANEVVEKVDEPTILRKIEQDLTEDEQKIVQQNLGVSPKEALFIDMWNEACQGYVSSLDNLNSYLTKTEGKYNPLTKKYELYDYEFTFEEALYIYSNSRISSSCYSPVKFADSYRGSSHINYMMPSKAFHLNAASPASSPINFYSCLNLIEVVIPVYQSYVRWVKFPLFGYSSKLKNVRNVISLSSTHEMPSSFALASLPKLETLWLNGLNKSLDISSCQVFSVSCLVFMIKQAGTGVLSITLHPDVYGKAIVDIEILEALASKPNITLMSV